MDNQTLSSFISEVTYDDYLITIQLDLNFAFLVIGLAPISLRQCNDVGILAQVSQILSFIGIQGTLAIRLFLIQIVAIILSDTLAFIGVIRQVWGVWRLKRSLGLRRNDFLTLLLQQGTLSFCFVLTISTSQIFLVLTITSIIAPSQAVVSALILCEFTLGLRRRNKKILAPNPSALSLPTLSFQDNPVQTVRIDIPAMDTQGPQASISRLPGEANSNEGPQDENQLEEDVEHRLVVENNMV
ncbi:hypothetical protein Clacol_009372 [Clathrus columnatus]|uniref:Uncharacterized protein n=1 Tax=Clathrus columnatus TaxID=1419009 RepID=A0AAV5AMT1_9AGAM|nr:hypothetical protein Clacol_009372 [Clathrus columnatus]